MKAVWAVLAAIPLMAASCAHQKAQAPIVVPKTVISEIPEDFLHCSGVNYPNPATLTDKQVARLLVALDAALRECSGNVEAIRDLQQRTLLVMNGKS